jgi:hypothetical protein
MYLFMYGILKATCSSQTDVHLSKIYISVEYSVLQALQLQEVSVHCIPPVETGVSHNWPNQSFVKHKFNIFT